MIELLEDNKEIVGRGELSILYASHTRQFCPTCLESRIDLPSLTGNAVLAALIRQSTEIPKVLAFDGMFEKLFGVVTREGGLEGQSVVADALKCVDTLLRFNPSNGKFI